MRPASVLAASAAVAAVSAQKSFPLQHRTIVDRSNVGDAARAANRLRNKWGHKTHQPADTNVTRRATQSLDLVDMGADTIYYAQLQIGTPSQSFNVILDTGSSDLWLLSPECRSAGCLNAATYDFSASSTFTDTARPLRISYGSGDVSGHIVTDTVSIAGLTVARQGFGLITTLQANLLSGEIGGLLGLAFETIAQTKAAPLWQALYEDGQLTQPMMAFALERNNGRVRSQQETNPGGVFTIGGVDNSLYTGEIEFIPCAETLHWTLPVEAITINGATVTGVRGTTGAIDTGTTLIAGPLEIVQQIYASIGGQPGTGDLEGLWTYPCSAGDITTTFNFGGKSWTMSPDDFLFGQASTSVCIGAFIDLELGDLGPTWIVGDAFLKNVYSVYRWSDPPAVGFAARGSGGNGASSGNSGSSSGGSNSSGGGGPFGLGDGAATVGVPLLTLCLAFVAQALFA